MERGAIKEIKGVQDGKEEDSEEHERIAAFFDLDGTLVALPSLERRFFRMLRYRKAIPAWNYLLWLGEAVRLVPRGLRAISQANKMYLRGGAVDRAETRGLTLRFRWGEAAASTFFRDAIERVEWHARQGHAIVLVSGTLEPLAAEAARALETELATRGVAVAVRVCATRLEEADGCWTGRIVGEAMVGKAKGRAAQRMAAEMRHDLAQCYAYGDNSNDWWMLAAVGRPATVNPSRDLARIAQEHGWPILRWEPEKKVTMQRRLSATLRASREGRGIPERASVDCSVRGNAGEFAERAG